jgi:hypothetical protein
VSVQFDAGVDPLQVMTRPPLPSELDEKLAQELALIESVAPDDGSAGNMQATETAAASTRLVR